MANLDPAHIAWSRRQFDIMAEGAIWGVPRSGMIFQRRGDTLVLIECMPHMNGMPVTPAQLAEQQQYEYEAIAEHFTAAGIIVIKGDHVKWTR
jgi:hypothetical protein